MDLPTYQVWFLNEWGGGKKEYQLSEKDHRRQKYRLFQEKIQPSSNKTIDGEIWKGTQKNFLYMKS